MEFKFRFLIIVGILDGRELDVLAIGDLVDKIILFGQSTFKPFGHVIYRVDSCARCH
jgi:hypothetical protein